MGQNDDRELKIRIRSRLHAYFERWIRHWSFNGFIMFCIIVNAITLAVETVETTGPTADSLESLDFFFLAVYTMEFFIKQYVSPTAYFTNAFCLFDFLVLGFSWADCIVTNATSGTSQLSGLRVLRILRTLRILRSISFVPALQVIVAALMTTVKVYMLNLMVVLLLIMFIFGVMGYYLYGAHAREYSNLGEAMLSLATLVTLDSWTEIVIEMDPHQISPLPAKWFCVIFILIGNYIYTNVFVSIVIVNLNDAQQDFIDADRAKRREIVAEKTITMNQKQKDEATSFRHFLEQDQRVKFANYDHLMKSVNKLLSNLEKSNDVILCGDTSLNLLFVQEYLGILDQVDNETFMQRNLYRELGNLLSLPVERQLKISGLGEKLLQECTRRCQINQSRPP